jgi:hypothetical protein
MTTPADPRRALEEVLGHPVHVVVTPLADGGASVAVSTTGDPARVRAAWVTPSGDVVARIGCPPGVPSAVRPVVATIADIAADGVSDHMLLGRVAPGVAAVRALLPERGYVDVEVGDDGILAGRIPREHMPLALDALAPDGESIGRLTHPGITELALVAGRVEGRMGATHGMAAGFGAGDTVTSLHAAEAEAGYAAALPAWLPDGFVMATVRVEPEAAYPFAPPAIAIAWVPGEAGGDARVLLRQGPGPLAVPEQPDARGRLVDVGGAAGVVRARGMVFLVWEAWDRAFGLQVRSIDAAEDVALAVARSIPAPSPWMA